jgi:hypothetical protein
MSLSNLSLHGQRLSCQIDGAIRARNRETLADEAYEHRCDEAAD